MSRSRSSAKQAGSSFERLIADYLAEHLDDRIDRRVKTGGKDKGDIANVRTASGDKIVLELKNVIKLSLSEWIKEAHVEAVNDNALVGVVVHKRHGNGKAGEQWVTMTVDDLVRLLKSS